jgi:ABC-type lipoprotein release transport system permease subunit
MNISKSKIKNIIIAGIFIALGVGALVWYLYTETFGDTGKEKSAYTISAMDIIKEFKRNDTIANKKYAEKIVTVTGIVTALEFADTTVNIKMADSTGSYVIFGFQSQHLAEAKSIKQGDDVSIKGSCSGGAYSEILEAEFITFKRCALNK